MKLTLTGINFNYTNGFNAEYTDVKLNFNSSGGTFNSSGYVTVTKDQYSDAAGDPVKLVSLVKQQVIASLDQDA
ncbi:hypothetical protein JOD43_002107 [Pullulanibacillus pueri]|uniref:Uncharacterized protein n=1 Tax=Pullulanibacillus pueri TaxID=1437324 RepID=A0A8J3EMJ0_9BACL|nr:hypothetical protein [Pullulanibacillus pueri]MBM7681935.1 hypothetical protein [Pullulanibacillus pueri]GGH83508.1 hypothetical protein GCM10007096_24480 [Pullulanibacillus pueri]